MSKVWIELEIAGRAEDAFYVVGKVLDEGVLQKAISAHEYTAARTRVLSAVIRAEGFERAAVIERVRVLLKPLVRGACADVNSPIAKLVLQFVAALRAEFET